MAEETLDKDQVQKAVHALFQLAEKKGKSDRGFLGEGDNLLLQVTFKKVPDVDNQVIKIPLPTSLMRESSDACLFVKDLDKNNRDYAPSVEHFKDLLESNGVSKVAEIIPLKMLKIEYQPFEAKRNLSNMYEVYLADERIYRLLPNLLGKSFYSRKRYPISVDLQVQDLKKEIEKAFNSTRLIISGRGSSCQVCVAHDAMTEVQVVDNIMAVFERLKDTIPDGVENIKHMHLRFQWSPSLPIFASQGSVNEIVPKKRKRKIAENEPEEISTLMDKKVQISPEGDITFFTLDGVQIEDEEIKEENAEKGLQNKKQALKKNKKGPTKNAGKKLGKPQAKKPDVKPKKSPKKANQKPKEAESTPVAVVDVKPAPKKVTPRKGRQGKVAKSDSVPKVSSLKEKSKGKNGQVKGKPKVKKLKAKQ